MYTIRVRTEISSFVYFDRNDSVCEKEKNIPLTLKNVDIASILYNYKKVSILLRLFI